MKYSNQVEIPEKSTYLSTLTKYLYSVMDRSARNWEGTGLDRLRDATLVAVAAFGS